MYLPYNIYISSTLMKRPEQSDGSFYELTPFERLPKAPAAVCI
jgi:hypothetical protein